MDEPDLITPEEAQTLPGLFRRRVARTPDAVAYLEFDAVGDTWREYRWREVESRVEAFARALAAEELVAGERVAVQARNSVTWVCFEQAALALGLVLVPLYDLDNSANVARILEDSGARLLLAGRNRHWQALRAYDDTLPDLRRTVCLQPPAGDGKVVHCPRWLAGVSAPARPGRLSGGELATLVYTSGTTGRAKGVMLSHRNILSNAAAVASAIPPRRSDLFLSCLPLSHMFERTAGYYVPMMAGSRVAFSHSIARLSRELETIRPTVLISVPSIYERAYATAQRRLERRGLLARWLCTRAVEIGWRRFLHAQGRGGAPHPGARLLWPLCRSLVARRILARFGGRIRVAISGGAALDGPVARFFLALGLPLLQGYGLTEASPVVSGNRPDANDPDSVGRALPGVETRVDDDGQLLVRGPGVMLGYWRLPAETRASIDPSGWLQTGDLAECRNGFLYVRGRLKELLVTSSGVKVGAASVEAALVRDPAFAQALVVGEGRPFLVALIVLEPSAWKTLANACAVAADDPAALRSPRVLRRVLQKVNALTESLPAAARVRGVVLTLQTWSMANNLLTPTMKPRRDRLQQRYAAEIDDVYRRHRR